MGFRSTFTTEDHAIEWPGWFRDRYADSIRFPGRWGTISASGEAKHYGAWARLPEDIRRAIDWDGFGRDVFVLAYLHECGGVTRVEITRDAVRYSEPEGWEEVDGVRHLDCYRCSDLPPPPPASSPAGGAGG